MHGKEQGVKDFIEENRVVVREFVEDGKVRLEVYLDGAGVDADPNAPASVSMMVVAAMFSLYTDGTTLDRMRQMFGFQPGGVVEMKLENMDVSIPGNA